MTMKKILEVFENPNFIFKNFDTLVAPIDKLSNYLFAANVDNITNIIEDKRLNINSPVKLIIPTDENGKKATITPFEKLVLNVLLSAQEAGNEYISYSKLFHLLGGGHALFKNATKMHKAIDKALWKLRCTDLTITMTDIVSARKKYAAKCNAPYNNKQDKKKITFRGVLLPNEVITLKINGKPSDSVIHFLGKSVILRVADLKDQIARASLTLLSIPIRTTENTLTLTGYLLERILKIKGSNDENKKHVTRLDNSISFSTLFKECGLNAEDKRQRYEIRQIVKKILDFFKNQDFIANYELIQTPDGDFSIKISF